VSLSGASGRRDDARTQLRQNIDPSVTRREEKLAATVAATPTVTFTDVATEYWSLQSQKLSATTKVRDVRILGKLSKSPLGQRSVAEIEASDVLAALRAIEADGAHETAHRALGFASRIWSYALATGKATRDATSGLGRALAPVVSKQQAAITDAKKFGAVLRAIDGYSGQPATVAALKLLPLLFVRPGELRMAHWGEFDLEAKHPQ
jgi:integrase